MLAIKLYDTHERREPEGGGILLRTSRMNKSFRSVIRVGKPKSVGAG